MGERRSRNLLVQLGPKMQAYPEELIRQRRSYDGLAEYLIRWNVGGGSGSNGSHSSSSDNKVENILMWMSVEDVYANCPTLLGKRKLESQRPKEEQEPSAGSCPSGPDSDVTFDDVELLDMKEDVKLLVERARRQMSRKCGADSSLNISHTIHVLSAYASIGSLVGVFKETGALDVLMELLCNKETQTRRSAGKMLRALASHDAGSRAYVLLSLSQQDGIEQHMDFDNRYTLLELFAETTSSEEHGISFEGIHLPQIPGKLLFSLVKRYLCVTSLMDKLNNSGQEAGGERQDCNAPHVPEQTRILREFEFTLAMANLISELVRVMGWDRNRHPEPGESEMPRNVKSIFQPRSLSISSVLAPQPRKKSAATYKTRSNFSSRSSYVEYVQENLKAGMTVKMLEDYEQVNAGDEGEFRFSNDGTPPVQVFWHQLNRTYWVHWHMIEIIEDGWNGQVDKEIHSNCSLCSSVTQTFFHKPPGGLYSLPYLSDNVAEDSSTLSRAEWWEVLFFIKKLEPKQQQEAVDIIHQSLEEQVSVRPLKSTPKAPIPHCRPPDRLERSLGQRSVCAASLSTGRATIGLIDPELGRKQNQPVISNACMCFPPRILNKFLDNYQEDLLPWHESIEPCLSSMTAFSNDREVLQDFIRFLYGLATVNKDYAVVMCRLGSKETLSKALDKHSATLPLAAELRDLVGDCEKYASLYKKMTTSILAGCIQMVLGQIEEHRRSHQPINIPFFHVFLRNLCQGSGVELKEDKCWEKIEVSSNHHRTSKLTDKNPKSYWESNGSTGSHYINIYMHKGVVIRQLTLLVASEDSSYMPARVVVMGGDDPSNINTELNTVNVAPTANRVLLLENMTRYWSIIQIRIKRCQQGGIDTRVHGFEVLGPKPTFWPVFKEQLCCRTYLFYTTKAHTWCQEILEDRMQLLQLFNKLNSALRHEQMFADRFLPDAEASEALGRTCWEALINPIVQSITTLGNADPSPLTWLLTEYLENSDNSKRGKGRAVIFNSRVRRLCHLLVHVDTSRNEVEELKPAIKSGNSSTSGKGQPRSKPGSIAGIAQCWHAVVQQQVKHFLDGAWNSTDFVQRYRNMYLRLKNAMEELFGQQTAFVLALRKGFSGGLLQLSHLTAMHVSERFAQYIDQRIQESGADASSVETLNQLQQFLEPMLFFSGLELANIFEHFYRYYLGDRLLGQGKVWLERAIIDQIGSCFPGRFPQQMLKNLSESNELQQEFHLYRLQQLDKKLENMDDEVSSVMEEVEMPLAEPETELAVLVLSPRCWSISLCHLENPARYFPPDLSDFLEEFSDFYTSSEYRSHPAERNYSTPRRLQWTWLGHAVLSYGSLTLHVSTLQMYILLLFNQQEEIAVETILRLTGLSLVLVQHALKPLIEEDGILSHTQTEQSQFKGRLNGEALERGSVVSQCYTLLPKQTYLNVDEDAASALDRKRNVIYCIIVQIMKSEKELHIDNLVFKSQETSAAQRFLQFSCSNMDVLCCIMHLINEGYVRRNEDNPHILEYVLEDPITPRKGQAHIMFRKPGSKGSESNNGKENLSVFR
uniref:Cullin 7 n=1 Tax=Callorhinchus milii TaxID=7868 RepID=A0A4W3JYY6_CALMI